MNHQATPTRALFTRTKGAFSLLEVVIAILVLGATATVFAAYMPTAMNTGSMVGHYQQASSLVQHKIDQMRCVGYGRLTYSELRAAGIIDSSPETQPYSFKKTDGVGDLFTGANATISVENYSSDMKKVSVSLTWTGSTPKPSKGSVVVTALIAKG